jgi:hypothetical protein
MARLTISPRATISQSETLLSALANMETPEVREILVPSNFVGGQCGGLAAMIQFIVTWARTVGSDDAIVNLYAQTSIQDFVSKLPGLVSVMMAKDVRFRTVPNSVIKECYGAAKLVVQSMNIKDLSELAMVNKGMAVELLCADETSKWSLLPLYDLNGAGDAKVRPEKHFIALAKQLVEVAAGQINKKRFTGLDYESIGVMLRELFLNTHDHARSNEQNRPYQKSVRGIIARHNMLSGQNIAKIGADYKPLEDYFRSSGSGCGEKWSQYFELSIFDSGPGFAANFSGKSIDEINDAQLESSIVQQCLMSHVSSSLSEARGIGLPRMLHRLKIKKGFLRLRTGHLSLYKSFADASINSLDDSDFVLQDAETCTSEVTRHARTFGTVLTVLFPLRAI